MDEEKKISLTKEEPVYTMKSEETRQLEILENFAKQFKQERIRLGFTQSDVGLAIGHLYGSNFSQTTISRFEALNLSFKNMSKLKPLLEKWLKLTNEAIAHVKQGHDFFYPFIGVADEKQTRKKRTSFDKDTLNILNRLFMKNPKPTSNELETISSSCGLDVRVIRVWFYNRRQRQKRLKEQRSHFDMEQPDLASCQSKHDSDDASEDKIFRDVPPLLHVQQLASLGGARVHDFALGTYSSRPDPVRKSILTSSSYMKTGLGDTLSAGSVPPYLGRDLLPQLGYDVSHRLLPPDSSGRFKSSMPISFHSKST